MIFLFELLTCSTALIRSRSSVGFHRPRSLVICRGCLLFFTLLVMGGGFITMARGGVRVVPDFVTWHHVSKVHKSSIAPLQALLQPCFLMKSVDFMVIQTFFFSQDESSFAGQRTGSMTGGPLTLLDDFTRLLSTSSSSNFFLFIDLGTLFCQYYWSMTYHIDLPIYMCMIVNRTMLLYSWTDCKIYKEVYQTWKNFYVWEHHCQMLVLLSFSYLLLRATLRPLTGSGHLRLPSMHQPQGHLLASVTSQNESGNHSDVSESGHGLTRCPYCMHAYHQSIKQKRFLNLEC